MLNCPEVPVSGYTVPQARFDYLNNAAPSEPQNCATC